MNSKFQHPMENEGMHATGSPSGHWLLDVPGVPGGKRRPPAVPSVRSDQGDQFRA
jgi:hypothetical protein